MNEIVRSVRGWEYRLIQGLMLINIWMLGIKLYRNPAKASRALSKLVKQAKKVSANVELDKGYRVGGKYGWNLFNPMWPSKAFNRFFYHHLEQELPSGKQVGVLRRLLIAITKKCPLQCEHCSEWATLNQKDILDKEAYAEKIEGLLAYGVSQLVYSGGEPLNRFKDLLFLLNKFKDSCSQWIYTSGYGLTLEKALALKAAGLEGAAISLDHFDPEAHNRFRNNPKSFTWVEKAVRNCQEAGIVVSINVCTTREFIAQNGMVPFMELMHAWGVSMVNILEPRAVGHYEGKEVELRESEEAYLEEIFHTYNCESVYAEYPLLIYPALSRKGIPCGGGKSYLFLDYDGTLSPCPFCKTPMNVTKSATPLERCEV